MKILQWVQICTRTPMLVPCSGFDKKYVVGSLLHLVVTRRRPIYSKAVYCKVQGGVDVLVMLTGQLALCQNRAPSCAKQSCFPRASVLAPAPCGIPRSCEFQICFLVWICFNLFQLCVIPYEYDGFPRLAAALAPPMWELTSPMWTPLCSLFWIGSIWESLH